MSLMQHGVAYFSSLNTGAQCALKEGLTEGDAGEQADGEVQERAGSKTLLGWSISVSDSETCERME